MPLKLQSAMLTLGAALSLVLSGCDSNNASSIEVPDQEAGPRKNGESGELASSGSPSKAPNLAEGPDVCFRAIAKHLGASTKVSEITSFFSAGNEIDSSATRPLGEMTVCSVEYQNPDDPRKLLSARMNVGTGEFDTPRPVEIRVAGGNAAEFNLDDYLIPLSEIDPAALVSVMNAQKAKLAGVYGRYAWSGVRLSAPGAFSNTHTLRLDLSGRVASNDIKSDGYASVTTDGKTITANHLMP